jgi:hypothetical protein
VVGVVGVVGVGVGGGGGVGAILDSKSRTKEISMCYVLFIFVYFSLWYLLLLL